MKHYKPRPLSNGGGLLDWDFANDIDHKATKELRITNKWNHEDDPYEASKLSESLPVHED